MSLPAPFINLPSLPNLRAIGPYPTAHARLVVNPRIVYRSVDPSHLTPSDLTVFRDELGITTLFDLRSLPEIERANAEASRDSVRAYEKDGLTRAWVPVFAAQDYSPEKVALRYAMYAQSGSSGFVQAYKAILEHGGPSFKTILQYLATAPSPPQPCLVHCTAGKDRTGVFVALLLSLLGVEDNIIADEYALTDVGLGARKEMLIARLTKNEAFQGPGGSEGAERMVTTRPENMRATLQMLRSEWGGAEGYVKIVCGLGDDVIARVRDTMLVQEEEAGEAAAPSL